MRLPQNNEWFVLAAVLGLVIALEAGPKLLNMLRKRRRRS